MKHEMEESNGGFASKQRKVREFEKLPTLEEFKKINFLGCIHLDPNEGKSKLGKKLNTCQNQEARLDSSG